MAKRLPKTLDTSARQKRLLALLEEYVGACRPPPEADTKKAGGKFANLCAPAKVFSIVLSDIIGDPLDMIASGPAYPDTSTCEQAVAIAEKYALKLDDATRELLTKETPKELTNVTTQITGSVRELCVAVFALLYDNRDFLCVTSPATVVRFCRKLGYEPVMLTDQLCCQAKEAGSFLSSVLKTYANSGKNMAFLAGGETVVLKNHQGMIVEIVVA